MRKTGRLVRSSLARWIEELCRDIATHAVPFKFDGCVLLSVSHWPIRSYIYRCRGPQAKKSIVSWKSVVYYYFSFYGVNRKNFAFNPYSIHTIWRELAESCDRGNEDGTCIHFIVDNVQVSHAIGRCMLSSEQYIEFEQWPFITLMFSWYKQIGKPNIRSHTRIKSKASPRFIYRSAIRVQDPVHQTSFRSILTLAINPGRWYVNIAQWICKWCAIDISPERRR